MTAIFTQSISRPIGDRWSRTTRRGLIWRAFWAVVTILHAPLTLHAAAFLWRADAVRPTWTTLLVLTISNLYFLSEVAFALTLRLLSRPRDLFVFIMIVLLLHAGVLERGLPDALARIDGRAWLLFGGLSTVTLFRYLSRLFAALRQIALSLVESAAQLRRLWCARAHRTVRPAPLVVATRRARPLRAPPHSAL